MTIKNFLKGLWVKEILVSLLILTSGLLYVLFIWNSINNQNINTVLQNALSIEASLPKNELDSLPENAKDLEKQNFDQLKKSIRKVIEVNPNARFAYVYILRNNKYYFLADSEPESSPNYSHTGQDMGLIFDPNAPDDRKLFYDKKALVTKPVTDQWGTWVSVQIPIKHEKTGQMIAALGIDYNAGDWNARLLFEVLESFLLVIIILFLIFVSRRNIHRNLLLKKEITQREKAEKELKESESYFRLLFELNPQPMFIYDLESMRILRINNSAIKLYGYSEEEFLAMSLSDLKAPTEFSKLWENLMEDPPSFQRIEVWNHHTKDGRMIQVEVHSHNLDFRDKNTRLVLLIDITEKLETEKDLRKNELVLTTLISNLPGIVYRCTLDPAYTMKFMSNASLHVTGYLPEDFIGNKTVSFSDLILPEYRKPIWDQWQKTLNEKSVFEAEYPIRIASGEIRWVWERGRCVYNESGDLQYLEGYIENITERKLAEDELKKLSQAIEQNPASIVITDAQGTIEYVNPRFSEITGFQSHEAIGNSPSILKSGKMTNDFYANLWGTITSGKIWEGELINKNKAGEMYWANKSISPILNNQGQITHYVAIAEDITEKKKTQEELIKAKEKAEESDRLKSAFLANISHEIRTPMNGILGFAELLKNPELSSGNQQQFIDIIEKSGQRMLNIINDLIDISKIEANEITLNITTADLNLLGEELYLFFYPDFETKGLKFSYVSGLSGTESLVRTDSLKLYQILSNLIKNAFKFTSKGQVKFGYSLTDTKLQFFVKDTGVGIPDNQRNIIFERFRQGNYTLNKSYEGAGLGLTISKAYIELLGGNIQLESELNKGTTIRFEIPYHPVRQKDNLMKDNED